MRQAIAHSSFFFFFLRIRRPPRPTLFPYPPLFRSLEQNYRSHGNILDAANALISNNRNRLGKNLWTAAGRGEPIRVFEGGSDADEGRWIVEEVQSLAREGTRLSHMAVLYRSNAQSRVLEHALFSQGCLTACTAACAFSSARKSSMRSPTCGW